MKILGIFPRSFLWFRNAKITVALATIPTEAIIAESKAMTSMLFASSSDMASVVLSWSKATVTFKNLIF